MQPTTNRILVAVFLGFISMPLAANLAGVDGADPASENREMAAFPTFDGTWASLASYPAALTRWFDDHFAFRAQLVRWDAQIKLFALHTSPSPSVLLGKDGWLFYADDGGVEDLANASPLSDDEVETWREAIRRARDWLRAHGIAFVFTIAPDKHVIYTEQLPADVHRVSPVSRTDQLFAALADSGVTVDVRSDLFNRKTHEGLYHVTDTHWNDRGVFVAYQRIIEAARRQAPAVPPSWPRGDFEETSQTAPAGDLAAILGLKRVLREEQLLLTPRRQRQARVVDPPGVAPTSQQGFLVTEIPGSHLPRAVIFRDSFFSPLVPFLSEHFSRAVYLWQRDFLPEDMMKERPDVVIQELVGRHLYVFTPSPELVPK